MTTQDPPNPWMLDKRLSLMEQQLTQILTQMQILLDTREQYLARENQAKGAIWLGRLATGTIGGIIASSATWVKMVFWGHQ